MRRIDIEIRVQPGESQSVLERLKQGLREVKEEQTKGSGGWIQSLADVAAAVSLVQQGFAALSAAATEFYQRAIAQNLELERLILSSSTAIAGTNRVFREGLEITEPIQKIQALTGEVQQAFDYIREETFKLSGVTSSQVIPLFEVLATQIGNVGGGIQDAADLAVKFAAGLGVVGVPLVQARQEILSILTGTIDMNSQLAKTLGINNELVRQWQAQGTLVQELNARLQTFMAGNELQAKTLAGVTSNIQELIDEFFRLMGAPVVQPLVEGSQRLYSVLLENRELLQEIAGAIGERMGAALTAVIDVVGQVGEKLGSALSEALARFDLEKLELLLVNIGRVAEAAAQGLAEVGSWVIRLSGELLPPLINAVSDLLDTTIRGYQSLIDLAAVLAGGLTGEQVANLDAAQQLANDFGQLVDQVVNGSGVAAEAIEEFRQRLEAAAAQGAISAKDVEFYNQALERLVERNREVGSSGEIVIESLQAAAQAARVAADEYKRAVAEARLEQLTEQLELQQRINAAELANASEVAAERLRIERETNEAILEAARQRLQALLLDETANRDAILEVRSTIAQTELKLAELVRQARENQLQAETELIQAAAQARQTALAAERTELERRRELIADTQAALEQEGRVVQAQIELRNQVLQAEMAQAQAAVERARGTQQETEAVQRLAQLQSQAAQEQAAAQQQALERERELIQLRYQGSQTALEQQRRELEARMAGVQAEIEALQRRQEILGALTTAEQQRLGSLQQELEALRSSAQILAENRQQLEAQRNSELAIVELRRQQLEIARQHQSAQEKIQQIQELQRAQLAELVSLQARQTQELQNRIQLAELLGQADGYRAQAIEAQLQALRQQNEALGESQARTQQIQELERQLEQLRQEGAVRAAELAAQREAAELRSLENQREQLQLQQAQLQNLIAQLEVAGQLSTAEQEKLQAVQESLRLLEQQIQAQAQVAEAARQAADVARQVADSFQQAADSAQNIAFHLREAAPLTLQFVPLSSALADAQQWAEQFGLTLQGIHAPVQEQVAQWSQIVGQLQNTQALLQASADQLGVMAHYAQRFGGDLQQIDRAINRYRELAKEYEALIAAAQRRLEVEQRIIPVLEQQKQEVRQQIALAQGHGELLQAQLRYYDARIARLRAEGASEEQIRAAMAEREQIQKRMEILQTRINELKIQEKLLELEIQLAREQALNASSKKVQLLKEEIALQTQLLSLAKDTRAELERAAQFSDRGAAAPASNAGSWWQPSETRLVQRLPRSMAKGGPFPAGALLQVGDNPDGTPNRTTEWIRLSAPGEVLTSADLPKVVSGGSELVQPRVNVSPVVQPAPLADGRIVGELRGIQDLLKVALSVPAVAAPSPPAVRSTSLREFVLANL